MDLWEKADRTDTALSLLERGRQLLEALGLWDFARTAVLLSLATIGTAIMWLFESLPIWADCLIGLFSAACLINIYTSLRKAWALRGLKSLDIAVLGRDCMQFRADVFSFLVDRQDSRPLSEVPIDGDPKETGALMHQEWAKRVQRSQQTSARLLERFSARAIALSHLLQIAHIKPPSLLAFEHSAAGIAAYIGAVGELLQRGLLKEARELDPNIVLQMHFYVG